MKLLKIKNKRLDQSLIIKICKFKMKFWKHNFKSQLDFFKYNYSDDDLHFILIQGRRIIAYNVLKKYLFSLHNHKNKIEKEFLLFDSFLVDKEYRGKDIGSEHLKKNISYAANKKKPGFLLCQKKLIKFYKINNCQLIKKKNFSLKNYRKKKYLMSFNFDLGKFNKYNKLVINFR